MLNVLVGHGRRQDPRGDVVTPVPLQFSFTDAAQQIKGRRVVQNKLLNPTCWTKRDFSITKQVTLSSYSFDYRTITPKISSSPY